ncbi:MAG: hypothetical protein FJ279_08115 [Planctomycetes bacterium]|nr:hypothetical protein [Planctomycetota bacterium]MBM4081221.1 hypothetical protein [Planctomycetota bacterium]
MNWRAVATLTLGVALGQLASAQSLVKNGDAETGTLDNWVGFTKVVAEGAHSGKHCFSVTGAVQVMSKEFIPIDTSKTYVVTGWFKSAGKAPSQIYLGVAPFDEKKESIYPYHVFRIAGTETTLADACKPEDTVLKIANGAKWNTEPYTCVAFDVDDSGQLKDLPNRNLSNANVPGIGVEKVENKGGHWAVQLKGKCGRAYPAGTKVREHVSGATYMYSAAARKPVPMAWTEFKGQIKGVAKGDLPADQWWPGTKYAKLLILANFEQGAEFSLLADDLTLTAVEK